MEEENIHLKIKKRIKQKKNKNGIEQCIKIIAELVVNMNIIARIKFSSELKKSTSTIGYYSYTNRYLQVIKKLHTNRENLKNKGVADSLKVEV